MNLKQIKDKEGELIVYANHKAMASLKKEMKANAIKYRMRKIGSSIFIEDTPKARMAVKMTKERFGAQSINVTEDSPVFVDGKQVKDTFDDSLLTDYDNEQGFSPADMQPTVTGVDDVLYIEDFKEGETYGGLGDGDTYTVKSIQPDSVTFTSEDGSEITMEDWEIWAFDIHKITDTADSPVFEEEKEYFDEWEGLLSNFKEAKKIPKIHQSFQEQERIKEKMRRFKSELPSELKQSFSDYVSKTAMQHLFLRG